MASRKLTATDLRREIKVLKDEIQGLREVLADTFHAKMKLEAELADSKEATQTMFEAWNSDREIKVQ